MKNEHNFIAKIKITEYIYHHLRNKVTNEIRKSKIRALMRKLTKSLNNLNNFIKL